jgi:large subunit ribosomal protein L22
MQYLSTQKYIRTSPRKLRLVVQMIKGLEPTKAIEVLPLSGKRGAYSVAKVIKSAIANAVAKGENQKDLIFKEIQVGEGPRLKRGRPIARGQWHPIKKRMSHIRIILTTKPKPKGAIKENGTKN